MKEIFNSASGIQSSIQLAAYVTLVTGIILVVILKNINSLSNNQKIFVFALVLGFTLVSFVIYIMASFTSNYAVEVLKEKKETIGQWLPFPQQEKKSESESATDVRKNTPSEPSKPSDSPTDVQHNKPVVHQRTTYRSEVVVSEGEKFLDVRSRVVITAKKIYMEDGSADISFSPSNSNVDTQTAHFVPGRGISFRSNEGHKYMIYLSQPQVVNNQKTVRFLIVS